MFSLRRIRTKRHWNFTFVLMTFGFLTSCAPKVPVHEQPPILDFPYTIENVEVIDERTSISQGDIKIPAISFPNQHFKHVPALTLNHKQEIEGFFKKTVKGQGRLVRAVVYVVDTYQEFLASWSFERETGYAKIRIVLLDDTAGGEQAARCESWAGLNRDSRDASKVSMDAVYRISLNTALYKCVQSISADGTVDSSSKK